MSSENNGVKNIDMHDSEKGPLGLTGNQYWTEPLHYTSAIASQRVDSSVEGIVIDCPKKVFLDEHSSIPLVCLQTAESRKLKIHSLKTTTYLFAANMETGEQRFVKLAESPSKIDSREPSPGYSSRSMVIDLDALIGLRSSIGRNSLFLVCGPEFSNVCTIEVIPNKENIGNSGYKEIVDSLRIDSQPTLLREALQCGVENKNLPGFENITNVWSASIQKQMELDHSINLIFKINTLSKFVFRDEKLNVDLKGNPIFACIPLMLIGFNEDRKIVIDKLIGIPVVDKPAGDSINPLLLGHVSFPLSKFIEPENDYKSITLWLISMENRTVLECLLKE